MKYPLSLRNVEDLLAERGIDICHETVRLWWNRFGPMFAAFLGLVPRQNSSGGKHRLGRISKMGDGYLRKLLVVGATSVIRRARTSTSTSASWINALLERRPARVVTVAMANKNARIAWAVLKRGEVYRPPVMA